MRTGATTAFRFRHGPAVAGRRTAATALPQWIRPQLTRLVDQAPDGPEWLHEIKYDGYRLLARIEDGEVRLLTRNGLDKDPSLHWVLEPGSGVEVTKAGHGEGFAEVVHRLLDER